MNSLRKFCTPLKHVQQMGRFLLVASVLAITVPSPATTVDKLNLKDTVRIADVVVRGTIGTREPLKLETPQYSLWLTAYNLSIDHVYVGAVAEPTIKVCHPGGLTFSDGYTLDVPTGFPTHQAGDSVILMLEKKQGYYVITGLHQGKWDLEASANKSGGTTIIAHQGSGDANLQDAATKQKALPDLFEKTVMELPELESEIQAAAGESQKEFSAAKSAPVVPTQTANKSAEGFTPLVVNQPLKSTQLTTPATGEQQQ